MGLLLSRCWKRVLPGQEGILAGIGGYRRTLGPGRHFVNPHLQVWIGPAGSTQRFHVGEAGVITESIPSRKAPGKVSVAATEFPAWAARPIPVGTAVRIATVSRRSGVWVSSVRSGSSGPLRSVAQDPPR